MKSDTKTIPRRAGGTTVYYPEENTLITASSMAFSQVKLIAKKYAQLALWSSELDEDSVIAFTDLLTSEMAYQFAKAEDFNGFQGDGTSVYAGVLGLTTAMVSGVGGIIPTASVTTIGTGITSTTPTAWLAARTTAQILAVWNTVIGSLPVYAEGRAKWYMHKTMFWNLIAPILEAAGGNIAMYLSTGLPLKFLGYDVEMAQAMPTFTQTTGIGATGLSIGALLGDMLYTCFMGTRRNVKVITSNERFMEYDQLAIQVSQRVAITPVVGDSVLPALQAGPMVALQFPAT
jgi:HK97 family phage major capsid protein